MGKRSEKNKKRKIRKISIIILSLILVACIIYLVVHFYNSDNNKNEYNELYNEVGIDEATAQITTTNNQFIDKIKEIQKENPDVKGWIRIENTTINYPLLQTTDNDYYLTHNYKKEKNKYGSIFINSNSNIADVNSNVIIYGHNMKNSTGQMFADLMKYQDKSFYEQHPIVKIATETGESEYEIVYVFKSRIFYQDEQNVFRFYRYYNFENEKTYNEYINNCKKIELYDTGKTAKYGEQLITLITCEYSQENGRMVIVAKKIN